MWVKKRSANILEFQIGTRTGTNASAIICDDMYFDDSRWLTQARLDHNQVMSPCPVNGEFTGLIPDALGLCAKLSSECHSPDNMHYEVSACNYDEVYEEREYRCLGQWEEKGLVYTYTQRRDVGTYECFVGGMMSDKKIFIKEAGEHCQRHVNPYRYGMELNKIGELTKRKIFHKSFKNLIFCSILQGHNHIEYKINNIADTVFIFNN